jgi:hypothetical protein
MFNQLGITHSFPMSGPVPIRAVYSILTIVVIRIRWLGGAAA